MNTSYPNDKKAIDIGLVFLLTFTLVTCSLFILGIYYLDKDAKGKYDLKMHMYNSQVVEKYIDEFGCGKSHKNTCYNYTLVLKHGTVNVTQSEFNYTKVGSMYAVYNLYDITPKYVSFIIRHSIFFGLLALISILMILTKFAN